MSTLRFFKMRILESQFQYTHKNKRSIKGYIHKKQNWLGPLPSTKIFINFNNMI